MRWLPSLLAALLILTGCAAVRPEKPGEYVPPASKNISPAAKPSETIPETLPGDSPEAPLEAPEPPPVLADGEFARAADYIPDIAIDLRYAAADNFTGQVIYNFSDAYLRYGTIQKLAAVQSALAEKGLGLKIWDAYRPTAAQFQLWEICPDSRYVANPNRGFSSHSRGNTVDVTLVDGAGNELAMPTGFDDFSAKADRDYSDVSPEAAANALLLEDAMTSAGFTPYAGEWWHFSDADSYPVEEDFLPPHQEEN